jgi:hypothetical protein
MDASQYKDYPSGCWPMASPCPLSNTPASGLTNLWSDSWTPGTGDAAGRRPPRVATAWLRGRPHSIQIWLRSGPATELLCRVPTRADTATVCALEKRNTAGDSSVTCRSTSAQSRRARVGSLASAE